MSILSCLSCLSIYLSQLAATLHSYFAGRQLIAAHGKGWDHGLRDGGRPLLALLFGTTMQSAVDAGGRVADVLGAPPVQVRCFVPRQDADKHTHEEVKRFCHKYSSRHVRTLHGLVELFEARGATPSP